MNLTISPLIFGTSQDKNISKPKIITAKNFHKQQEEYPSNEAIRNYGIASMEIQKKSPEKQAKQTLLGDEFFINMRGYKKDEAWAKEMTDLMYQISQGISYGVQFQYLLEDIENKIGEINDKMNTKKLPYGIRRKTGHSFDIKPCHRGDEYFNRYQEKCEKQGVFIESENEYIYSPKPNEEYKWANTCEITESNIIKQVRPMLEVINKSPYEYTISNLSLARNEFNKLRKIKNPSVDDVMRSCAIIQWLIAQETPYVRGSDSIANILTKSIMHANGIFISPLKDGISLDFEAFDTDLDDYIKKYPDFFKVRPYKITF